MENKITKEDKLEVELECLRTYEIAKEMIKITEEQFKNNKEHDMDVNYLFEPDRNIEF